MRTMGLLTALSVTVAGAGTASAVDLKPVPQMDQKDFNYAKDIYFNRCAGCHGTLRKGATGLPLTPDKTRTKTIEKLASTIFDGTEGGMPGWGKSGVLTKEDATVLAKFLQNEPVAPPEWNMKDIQATWKVHIPVEARPTKPAHDRNISNFFGLILRDAGQIAIVDGDKKEVFAVLNSGFAVHTLRYSASGRYMYTIGRDGKATLVDLWMNPPATVAEVKTGIDARSIESSKYDGPKGKFTDKYAVVGNYWPPSYVILDGLSLEPLKVVGTRGYTYDTNEYHPEPRVAAIVASHYDPEWIINVKETGQVLLVDYSDIKNLKTTAIESERFLHDGGWDRTKRYTHPKSKHVWVDHALSSDVEAARSVSLFDIANLDAPPQVIKLADRGRIVHMEYNKAGDELWVALWDRAGELIVFDDKTGKEKTRIKDPRLVTPTGKFNVFNTTGDIY